MKRTVAFSKNATNVFFHILTACNLRCRHCYINPEQHGSLTLPADTIDQWLGLFADRAQEANVIFLGGEPTLHPDLPRAVRSARALGYRSVTVDTNGYLFNDFLAAMSPEEIDAVSFSLDGPSPEINDAIRGKGCFDRCVSGIRTAVARGFSTSLIYTVSKENLDGLEQMPPLIESLGVDRFFIQVIGIRGQSTAGPFRGSQLTRDEWMQVVPAVARAVAATGRIVSYPKVFLGPEEVFECAGNVADNFFIFPNGRVYRCPLCEDYPIHGRQIHDGRLHRRAKINEEDLFGLQIPEGCVMNKLVQPDNIEYDNAGRPRYRVACCLLKEEIRPE